MTISECPLCEENLMFDEQVIISFNQEIFVLLNY